MGVPPLESPPGFPQQNRYYPQTACREPGFKGAAPFGDGDGRSLFVRQAGEVDCPSSSGSSEERRSGNSCTGFAGVIQGMCECMAVSIREAMHSLLGLLVESQGEKHSRRPLPLWDGFILEYP